MHLAFQPGDDFQRNHVVDRRVVSSAKENNVNGWRMVVLVPKRGVLGMSGQLRCRLPPTPSVTGTKQWYGTLWSQAAGAGSAGQ